MNRRTIILLAVAIAMLLALLLAGLIVLLAQTPPAPGKSTECAHALELADAMVGQQALVLDHVRGVNLAHTAGDRDAAVFHSIAGQNALDAYTWTQAAYRQAATQCAALQ